MQGDPLSLGPQLVGSLLQQRDAEGQDARPLLHGRLAQRGPLHTCKAKGLCINLSWGRGSGPSQPGYESHALVHIRGRERALLHTKPCSTGRKGPLALLVLAQPWGHSAQLHCGQELEKLPAAEASPGQRFLPALGKAVPSLLSFPPWATGESKLSKSLPKAPGHSGGHL